MTPVLASIVVGLLAVVPPASDHETRAIKDRAGLFTQETIDKAQQRIDEARKEYGLDLMVETVSELPDLSPSQLRRMLNRESKERLRKAAQDHADEAGCRGLFVLIVNDPRHVTVVGWPAGYEVEISSVKRENLRKYLARELATDPNRALLGACNHFENIGKSIQTRPPAPLALLTALVLVGSLFGGWALLCFVRSRAVSPGLPIYQPAMLGSIFGVPAGYWIYDQLFDAERPLTPPPSQFPESPTSSIVDPTLEPDPADVGGHL